MTSSAKTAPLLASLGVYDKEVVLGRALAAWIREGGVGAPNDACALEAHGPRWFVVLRAGRGSTEKLLAVYRLRNDGALRRLRRWPRSIE